MTFENRAVSEEIPDFKTKNESSGWERYSFSIHPDLAPLNLNLYYKFNGSSTIIIGVDENLHALVSKGIQISPYYLSQVLKLNLEELGATYNYYGTDYFIGDFYFQAPVVVSNNGNNNIVFSVLEQTLYNNGSDLNIDTFDEKNRQLISSINDTWKDFYKLDKESDTFDRELNDLSARLSAYDRELTPEEASASDSQQAIQWRNVIRGKVRNQTAKIRQIVQDKRIGATSNGGKLRREVCSYYEQIKAMQIHNLDLLKVFKKFETLQKDLKRLVDTMNSEKTNGNSMISQANAHLRKIASNSRKR